MADYLMNFISEAEVFQLVLFFLLLTLLIIQIIFKIKFLVEILLQKRPPANEKQTPLSVLMTVRNEEENLSENLPSLLCFEDINYEVVVVDDFSQDNTLSVLGTLRKENKTLKVSSLNQETRFSVKLAQNIALKSATNSWVLSVPPTISESQSEWLKSIARSLKENLDVVVNYTNVLRTGKLYNQLFRIETFLLYLKSMSLTFSGVPFVYFENNVAFQKKKYFEIGGYGKKIKEPYANLELLFNQFLKKKKCQIQLKDETAFRFNEKITRDDYCDLLKRSFRIESHLSVFKRFSLALRSLFKMIHLPLSVVVILLFIESWPFVLAAVGLSVILHLFIIKIMQNRLNERKIFISSLAYELIMPYVKVVSRWNFNRKSRNQKWKNKT